MTAHVKAAAEFLERNGLKLVTAESCTAGLIASTLAEMPGSGRWLECAFVTYSADAKINCLGVRKETIERYNLTSEQVAREMAEGALHASRANVALANTGLAGPSNGDSGIPVGTICFAWCFEHAGGVATFSETRRFDGDRNQVRCAGRDHALGRIAHYHRQLQSKSAA